MFGWLLLLSPPATAVQALLSSVWAREPVTQPTLTLDKDILQSWVEKEHKGSVMEWSDQYESNKIRSSGNLNHISRQPKASKCLQWSKTSFELLWSHLILENSAQLKVPPSLRQKNPLPEETCVSLYHHEPRLSQLMTQKEGLELQARLKVYLSPELWNVPEILLKPPGTRHPSRASWNCTWWCSCGIG